MEDSKILDLFWQREERAIAEIEKKYRNYCATIAGNILWDKEDVGECLNDTWFRAWKGIPPEKPSNLRMYLAKITRNLAIDKYRSNTACKRGGTNTAVVLDELGGMYFWHAKCGTGNGYQAVGTYYQFFFVYHSKKERPYFYPQIFLYGKGFCYCTGIWHTGK